MTPDLPPGLPPLPTVPNGYDVNSWEYRGTNWNPGDFRNYAYYKPGLSDGWVLSFGMKPIGSSGHYIEAVREPAEVPASGETMTDRPTPMTAPLMHLAANESIEAVFRRGCDLERQRDAYAETLREIHDSGMCGNVVLTRHPELSVDR